MKIVLGFAAAFAASAILLGAWAAHGSIVAVEYSSTFAKAKDYLFYHALALLCLVTLQAQYAQLKLKIIAYGFIIGTLFFSGSLILLSLTAWQSFASLTPIGGISLLFSWLALLLQARHI